MSMYNMLFGPSEVDPDTLALVLEVETFGRFRDVWMEDDPHRPGKHRIAVYTRNGGGNREHSDYVDTDEGPDCRCTGCVATFYLPSTKYHLFNRDDAFDYTYATFYFMVPEHFEGAVGDGERPVMDTDQRWSAMLDALGKEG